MMFHQFFVSFSDRTLRMYFKYVHSFTIPFKTECHVKLLQMGFLIFYFNFLFYFIIQCISETRLHSPFCLRSDI